MNKKILLILIIITTLIIAGCSSSEESTAKTGTTSNILPTELSEEQRYVNVNAEITCFMLGIEDPGQVLDVEKYKTMAEKHGFTFEELQTLKPKYETKEFAEKLITKIKQECPEQASKIDGNNI
jgi:hypothetical protein